MASGGQPDYDNIYPPFPLKEKLDHRQKKIFAGWTKDLERVNPSGNKLLEIGCSYGFFVEYLQQKGWSAEGVDICSNAISYAQNKGLNCSLISIEDFIPKQKYDAIVMIHVLEHLPNPIETLKTVRNWLLPEGFVYLRVPNFSSQLVSRSRANLLGHLKPREHLYYFTPKALTSVLSAAGFSSKVWTGSRNSAADLLNNYLRSHLVLRKK